MYIVGYTSGSYDDFESSNLFITEDLEIAENYIKKATRILNNIKSFVELIDEQIDDLQKGHPDREKHLFLWSKYHGFSEINGFNCHEIEQR